MEIDKFVNFAKMGYWVTRPSYKVSMIFNSVRLNEVIIDQHYKINHPEMTDEIIFQLVFLLNGDFKEPEKIENPFKYYVEDSLMLNDKPYRLIFLTEKFKQYIGVVNAFRVKEKKDGLSF